MTRHFLAAFFTLLVFVSAPSFAGKAEGAMTRDMITIQSPDGQDHVFNVEFALTGAQQTAGLMNRTSMPLDAGMLFVFGSEDERVFWMKNTLIPLDMLFISHDGTIRHIHHNAKPLDMTHITSEKPAMAVLELNGGVTGTLGIKEGDKVIHKIFRNDLAH